MTQELWVPGPLPGQNEIIKAAKSGRGKGNAYARMKSQWSATVQAQARSQRLQKVPGRVSIDLYWVEPTRKRDPDNVHAAVKFVLDGLVAAGLIDSDAQRTISRITHHPIEIHREPGVAVVIEESI